MHLPAQPAQQTMWPQGTKTTWILASMHTTHSRVRRRRSSSRAAAPAWIGAELRMTATLAMEGGWELRVRGSPCRPRAPAPAGAAPSAQPCGLHARQALQHLPLEPCARSVHAVCMQCACSVQVVWVAWVDGMGGGVVGGARRGPVCAPPPSRRARVPAARPRRASEPAHLRRLRPRRRRRRRVHGGARAVGPRRRLAAPRRAASSSRCAASACCRRASARRAPPPAAPPTRRAASVLFTPARGGGAAHAAGAGCKVQGCMGVPGRKGHGVWGQRIAPWPPPAASCRAPLALRHRLPRLLRIAPLRIGRGLHRLLLGGESRYHPPDASSLLIAGW